MIRLKLRRSALALLLAIPMLWSDRVMAGPAAAELAVPFERYTLSNGLEVILHRDPSAPLAVVDLWYHVGSGDEMPGKSGFAHLFEHMMFQGTANTGEDRHFPVLQQAGASDVNGSTNSNRTNYYETVPSNQLETALWLESERMAHLVPAITQKSLQNQRDVVRNERRQSYDNVPYGKERFALAAALYPEGHPFRHLTIGLHEDVEGGSIEDVRDFFRTWYVPANATLVVAGDIDLAKTKALIEKWFGTLPKTVKPPHRAVPTPSIAKPRRVEVHDSFAKLRRVHFAWVSPPIFAPGDAELDLLSSVLTNEGTGRLYRRLVLEKQLAQSVVAYQASVQRSSEYHVRVDLRPGADVAEVERIVGEELAAVRTKPIEARELSRAVIAYESQFVHGLEPLAGRVETLQSYNHFLGDPGRVSWDLARYRKVTPADVQAVASRVLDPQRVVEVVTQPVAAPQEDPAIAFDAPLPAQQQAAKPQNVAFPDEDFRKKQPTPGAEPALKTPPVDRFTLANGLEVYLLERHQVPTVRLLLEIPNGPVADPAGREGMSELCMDVVDDGTRALDKVAFESALADLGTTLSANAAIDRQAIGVDALSRNLEPSLDLWAATVTDSGLRADDFARDKAQHLAALQQQMAAPVLLARRLVGPVFYGAQHPVGRLVTDASLQAITLDDCHTLASTWIKPKGSRLFVVGDVTRATLESGLNRRLAGWSGEPAVRSNLPDAAPSGTRLFFANVPGAAQSVLFAGEPGPSRSADDYPATRLAMDVLGGDFASRMNMNLREDKGYAYGASAYIRYYPMHLSVVRAAATVRTDATKDALKEMTKELRHIAAGGITADELVRNVNGEVLGLPARFATGDDALAAVHELVDFGLPADYWETFAGALRRVTREQADAAAAAHVHPQQMTYLVVGDRDKVLPGLKELLANGDLPAGELVELDADGKPVPAKP